MKSVSGAEWGFGSAPWMEGMKEIFFRSELHVLLSCYISQYSNSTFPLEHTTAGEKKKPVPERREEFGKIKVAFHGCVSPGSQGLPGLMDIPSGAQRRLCKQELTPCSRRGFSHERPESSVPGSRSRSFAVHHRRAVPVPACAIFLCYTLPAFLK